uniref:Uncharacterized protein n=1 Tax=Rhipicephalus microplus TaxID=6941 RepID=A0A6G5AII7_RHIMP
MLLSPSSTGPGATSPNGSLASQSSQSAVNPVTAAVPQAAPSSVLSPQPVPGVVAAAPSQQQPPPQAVTANPVTQPPSSTAQGSTSQQGYFGAVLDSQSPPSDPYVASHILCQTPSVSLIHASVRGDNQTTMPVYV